MLANPKQNIAVEACRIGVIMHADGKVDVGAPMQHKQLCYDILKDARKVMARTHDRHFRMGVREFAVVMDMAGRVDVSAPLPIRELAYLMLDRARDVIEQYNDAQEPAIKPFKRAVLGEMKDTNGD